MDDRVAQYLEGNLELEDLTPDEIAEIGELLMDAIIIQKFTLAPASVFSKHDTIQ